VTKNAITQKFMMAAPAILDFIKVSFLRRPTVARLMVGTNRLVAADWSTRVYIGNTHE